MDYQRVARARRYLYRFDQILDEMAEKMLNPNIVNIKIICLYFFIYHFIYFF